MADKGISMVNFNNPYYPSIKWKIDISALAGISTILQSYANTVRAQADIYLDILPNLPNTQREVREKARFYLDEVTPEIIQVYGDIIDFGNMFTAYYGLLYPLAREIQNDDNSRVNLFVQGINQLLDTAEQKAMRARQATDTVEEYERSLLEQAEKVREANLIVDREVNRYAQELGDLRVRLNNLDRQINEDITEIAIGVSKTTLGIGLITVASLLSLPVGSVVLPGIDFTTEGTSIATNALINYHNVVQEYFNVLSETTDIQWNIAVFDTISFQMQHFLNPSDSGRNALVNLTNNWQETVEMYRDNINKLQNGEANRLLTTHLDTAKTKWQELGRLAQSSQINSRLGFNIVPLSS